MCFTSTCSYHKILSENLHTSLRSKVTAPIATTVKKARGDRYIQRWNFKRCKNVFILLRHVSSLCCLSPFSCPMHGKLQTANCSFMVNRNRFLKFYYQCSFQRLAMWTGNDPARWRKQACSKSWEFVLSKSATQHSFLMSLRKIKRAKEIIFIASLLAFLFFQSLSFLIHLTMLQHAAASDWSRLKVLILLNSIDR